MDGLLKYNGNYAKFASGLSENRSFYKRKIAGHVKTQPTNEPA